MMETSRHTRRPPFSRGNLFFGKLPELGKDPIALFQKMRNEHGPVVQYRLGLSRAYLVSHPEGIQHVLRDNAANYAKTSLYKKLEPMVGLGLLTSNGEFWKRQRRLSQPSFYKPNLEKFSHIMLHSTEKMISDWKEPIRSGRSIEIKQAMTDLTLDVVARALLGTHPEGDTEIIKKSFTDGLDHVMGKIESLIDLPESIPTPRNLKFRTTMKNMDGVVSRIIQKRKKEVSPAPDLLTSLLNATDGGKSPVMSEKQLKDEIITLFLAGQETTAMALTWTLYLLGQHPEIQEKAAEEAEFVLGESEPSHTTLSSLKYLNCVIQESMRLYPPAWWYGRTPLEDDVILGYSIPKGSIINIIPFVTHRDPDYWKDPEKFWPERFEETQSQKPIPYSYVPFAAGPRMCIGKDFALLELHIILAMILKRFKFEKTSDEPMPLSPGITLRPGKDLWMKLTPRD